MRAPFVGRAVIGSEVATVRVSGEGIERVADDAGAPWIVPGFVDIHIHGAFGVDFVTGDADAVAGAFDRLEGIGYEALLPTTVTAPVEAVRAFLARLPAHRAVAGFHLEGPFLSPLHPGAQPKEFILDPPEGPSEWDAVLDDPRLRVVTLAPERPGGLALARRLAARGVIASMGHTDATYAEARLGFEAGVRHATHTFNAMRPLHHREAGSVGFAMSEPEMTAELIYDRVHVSREAAGILCHAKAADRLIAVSDGTMAAGLPPGTTIRMWDLDVVVGEDSVRLKDGTLAGSSITLLDAFRRMRDDFGWETAIRATSLAPRAALRMEGSPTVWTRWDTADDFEVVRMD